MHNLPKYNLLGINYTASSYEDIVYLIIKNAENRNSFGLSALAVHGLIESYNDDKLKNLINKIDLIVPDGQPIKWCLNYFYKIRLNERIYGPKLTWEVLKKANEKKLKIFLFGSKSETLNLLIKNIEDTFPELEIVGKHVDRFRVATFEEDEDDIKKINASRANIILVGRGCPRQEIWVSEHLGKINGVMLAVGAAFDFHAKTIKQAPVWMQNLGLEWLFRLIQEPRRLWKRYLYTNSKFIGLIFIKILLRN